MASLLSDLVNNCSEGMYRIKCKYGQDDKNVKLVEWNIATASLNTQILQMIQQNRKKLWQKLSLKLWWKVKGKIFKYLQIFQP